MRPLGGRLDESEMLGSTPYTYYGGERPLGRPETPLSPLHSAPKRRALHLERAQLSRSPAAV